MKIRNVQVKRTFFIMALTLISAMAWSEFHCQEFPHPKPPVVTPPPKDEELIAKLSCSCSIRPEGWKCSQLSGFEDYEWNHEKLHNFAQEIISASNNLPMKKFTIAIKGLADSKQIRFFKSWEDAPEYCQYLNKDGGSLISNRDLAEIRSCVTKVAIEAVATSANKKLQVKLLPPRDFKRDEKKFGDLYKAAVIYLLGDNGDC